MNALRIPIFFLFSGFGALLRSQTPVKEGEPRISHRLFYSNPRECLTHPNIFSILKLESAFKIADTCKRRGSLKYITAFFIASHVNASRIPIFTLFSSLKALLDRKHLQKKGSLKYSAGFFKASHVNALRIPTFSLFSSLGAL